MNIYLLKRPDDEVGYDEVAGFILVAPNGKEARELAANECGDEGHDTWTTPLVASCRKVGTSVRKSKHVLLQSFKHG